MQISVVVPDEVIPVLDRQAARDCRTRSAQACFYVVDALRRAGHSTAGMEAWPPVLPTVNAGNLADAKARLAEMEAELARLDIAERKSRTGLMPDGQERQAFLRGRIEALRPHITAIERMMA
jgi:hypothetical protein